MTFRAIFVSAALICAISSTSSLAQDIGVPNGFDIGLYHVVVVGAESSGDYSAMNRNTFAAGAFQIMPQTMMDLGYVSGSGSADDAAWSNYSWTAAAQQWGINSMADYLGSKSFQDKAFRELTYKEWTRISDPAKATIGLTLDGFTVREGGLLNAAHFLGAAGLSRFVSSGFDASGLSNVSRIVSQNNMADVAALNRYVKGRIKAGRAAHRDGEGAGSGAAGGAMSVSGAELGLSCFQNTIVTPTESVSSPFGVDRSGRAGASSGFHVGLDIVNAPRGGPMVAGLAGTVINAEVGNVNGVTIEVDGGLMRYAYLHNSTVKVRTGDSLAVGDVVSTMGDRGSPGATHLHLMVALRADVVKAAGESLGHVWAMGGGFGSKGAPLSTGAIPTSSDTYLVVNPETFLNRRIPFQPHLLTGYAGQGLVRPDGKTLEPTCGPTVDALNNAGISASSNGGSTVDGNIGYGSQAATSDQVVMALATEEARDAMMEYSYSSFYDLKRAENNVNAGSQRATGWAGMIAAYSYNPSN